jgi:formylglycine-generating enzyme required for sulfatase activity
MQKVTGGNYLMGYNGTTGPIHSVNLSEFYIAPHELTYQTWRYVIQWAEKHGYTFLNPGSAGSEESNNNVNHPVTRISWYDAVVWCNAASEMSGLTPVYYTEESHTQVYRNAYEQLALRPEWVKWGANGYRLPTEAEWEYAARSRGLEPGNHFGGSSQVADVAWYKDNAGKKTHPVGKKKPNRLGLYDISGNVWEWCWDWYEDVPADGIKDPQGAATGLYRVIRGGAWQDFITSLYTSHRNNFLPEKAFNYIGLRVVRTTLRVVRNTL